MYHLVWKDYGGFFNVPFSLGRAVRLSSSGPPLLLGWQPDGPTHKQRRLQTGSLGVTATFRSRRQMRLTAPSEFPEQGNICVK